MPSEPGSHPPYRQLIEALQAGIAARGYRAVIHFELEGVFTLPPGCATINWQQLNRRLESYGLAGAVIAEFWRNQWEFVSHFDGQSPLQEADNLYRALHVLPGLLRACGAADVLIQPVVWSGDSGCYTADAHGIFSNQRRIVHIPNAIQANISIADPGGNNRTHTRYLGEWLQYHLLLNSYANCLLLLPEEDAFKRLSLRQVFGLEKELNSPGDLSGGHTGSIALYKQRGKHNQPMGQSPLLYGADRRVLRYRQDWRQTTRVEHRLGASSAHYDPYINTLFILLNTLDALDAAGMGQPPPLLPPRQLPVCLAEAAALFERDHWLANRIDHYCEGGGGPGVKAHRLAVVREQLANVGSTSRWLA